MSAQETALATAAPAGLGELKMEQALALIRASEDLEELQAIRGEAEALAMLARTRNASRDATNRAALVMLEAERRIGGILDEQSKRGERARPADNLRRGAGKVPKVQADPSGESGEAVAAEPVRPKTLEELGIASGAAKRYRAVANVPEEKFRSWTQAQLADEGGEVSRAGLLRMAMSRNPHAASNVNNGDPHKNDRFTPREQVEVLKAELDLNWDAAGHPSAPATEVFGRKRIWTAEDDCFTQDWTGKRPLFNVPWDQLALFLPFAWLKVATGECELVACPIPGNRFEQPWAKYFVHPFRPDEGGAGAVLRFPDGRWGYGNEDDPEGERPGNSANMPSAVLIFRGPFVRSPRLPPTGTVEEVIAAQRFGGDQALLNLWRQALPIARGERAEPRASTAPLGSLLDPDRFAVEAKTLGFKVGWKGRTLRATCTRGRCGGELKFLLSIEDLIQRAKLEQLQEHARSHVGQSAKAKKGRKR